MKICQRLIKLAAYALCLIVVSCAPPPVPASATPTPAVATTAAVFPTASPVPSLTPTLVPTAPPVPSLAPTGLPAASSVPSRTPTKAPPTATQMPAIEVGKNLLGNPSFEQDPRSTAPQWTVDAMKTDLQADWSASTARTGTHVISLRTSTPVGPNFAVPSWLSKLIPIAEDQIYVVNVWAYTPDGALPYVYYTLFDARGRTVGGFADISACKLGALPKGKWTAFNLTFSNSHTVGATQVRVGLAQCLTSEGKATTLLYDDVFVGALTQPATSSAPTYRTVSSVLPPGRSAPRVTTALPRQNAYGRALPSVVWCDTKSEPVTVEAHIVGRSDVAQATLADYDDSVLFPLYDDGTHGDAAAGDNIFTSSGIQIPCDARYAFQEGLPISYWVGHLRVTLKDGKELERGQTDQSNPFVTIGLVDPRYKNVFPVKDFGNGLSATAYAFFIQDTDHQIVDHYPLVQAAHVAPFPNATRKLYSVLPDAFDVVAVTTGEQLMSADSFWQSEAVCGFDVMTSNAVKNIGLSQFNRTAEYGSAGKLKSAFWLTFDRLGIFEHEFAHTWGVSLDRSLGLRDDAYHWESLNDIGGVLAVGSVNGGYFVPYSPLELYLMGVLPSNQIPPIHVFDPVASAVKTVTIDQIAKVQGGLRDPAAGAAQKDFSMAFVVTQDKPYNDAAYAFFSLVSLWVTSHETPPAEAAYPSQFSWQMQFPAPVYWATGGRATLNTKLPVDLPAPTVSIFK